VYRNTKENNLLLRILDKWHLVTSYMILSQNYVVDYRGILNNALALHLEAWGYTHWI